MKRSPLRRVSKKKAALDREYYILRAEFLSRPENRYCPVERLIHGRFCVPTTDVHHQWGRGIYYLAVDTWLAVSREGHAWIESERIEATKRGWLAGPKASIIVDFIQEPVPPHIAE